MIRAFVMFVLCLALQPVCSAAHGRQRTGRALRNQLDSALTHMTRRGYSGAALVARDGRIILHKAYGLADRERGIRNTTDTLFAVASVTKVFTAAAILKLEMQGKLATDDLISKYLGPVVEVGRQERQPLALPLRQRRRREQPVIDPDLMVELKLHEVVLRHFIEVRDVRIPHAVEQVEVREDG